MLYLLAVGFLLCGLGSLAISSKLGFFLIVISAVLGGGAHAIEQQEQVNRLWLSDATYLSDLQRIEPLAQRAATRSALSAEDQYRLLAGWEILLDDSIRTGRADILHIRTSVTEQAVGLLKAANLSADDVRELKLMSADRLLVMYPNALTEEQSQKLARLNKASEHLADLLAYASRLMTMSNEFDITVKQIPIPRAKK